MFIDEHREAFGVECIARTLGVSASAYYERRSGRRSARAIEDERLLALIAKTHAKNYSAYGYRRLWKALLRAGEQGLARCTVRRLMKANGIRAPSAAVGPGARPRPIPPPIGAPTWSSATSRRVSRTSFGWPI